MTPLALDTTQSRSIAQPRERDLQTSAAQIAEALPGFTVGPSYLKQPVGTWLEKQGIEGVVGTRADWRKARSIFISAADDHGAVIDIDDPAWIPALLAAVPEIVNSFSWKSVDLHGGYVVRLAYPVALKAHRSIPYPDGRKGERASLRKSRAVQLVSGDHFDTKANQYDGQHYIPDVRPAITLTVEATGKLIELFASVSNILPRVENSAHTEISTATDDWTRAKANLDRIPPDLPYDDWIRVGLGLRGGLGESAVTLWDKWSAGSATKYPGPEAVYKKWASFQGSKRDCRAITAIANQYDPAGKCKPVVDRSLTTSERSPYQNITTNDVEDAHVAQAWGDRLHKSLRTAIYTFWGKAAKSVCAVLDTAIRHGQSFTVAELSSESGIPRATIDRVIGLYGAGHVFFSATYGQTQNETLYTLHLWANTQENSHSEFTKSDRQFALDNFLRVVVVPRLRMSLGAIEADSLVCEFLDYDDPMEASRLINARLDVVMTAQEKQVVQTLHRLASDWGKRLRVMACDDLPAGKDYTQAVVKTRFDAVEGKPDSWNRVKLDTGISPATYARTEKKLGIVRDPKYSDRSLELDTVDDLPPLTYDDQFKGFPRKLVIWQNGNSYREFDYAKSRRAPEVSQALAAGERVVVKYQTASIPRRMTEAEIAERDRPKENIVTQPHRPGISAPKPPAHVGSGYVRHEVARLLDCIRARLGVDYITNADGQIIDLTRVKGDKPLHTERELIEVYLSGDPEDVLLAVRDIVLAAPASEDFDLHDYLIPGQTYNALALKNAYFATCDASLNKPGSKTGAKFREAVCALGSDAEAFFYAMLQASKGQRVPGSLTIEARTN